MSATRQYFRKYREANRSRIQEKKRQWADAHPEAGRRYAADQARKTPAKVALRKMARKAGMRASKCANCGRSPVSPKDGRTLLQIHHVGYGKNARTTTLCPSCHGKKRLK